MRLPLPIASLSLDLDNQWSYLKTHGDAGWETFPSYLDIVVPRALQLLARQNLQITFFVVGQDAALEKNYDSLRMIAAAGHEIGNHSFSHEPWLYLYDEQRTQAEIALAEEAITRVTGQRPAGFRGPGFTSSEEVLRVLEQRCYLYDASTLPTFLGPLARLYYLLHSNLSGEARRYRQRLFGSFRDGLRPLKPYYWHSNILEIPVTTMPFFRTPIHMSYLLYMSAFSRGLALAYFHAALRLCRWAGVSPSLLLHPLDFLGADDDIGLRFFPGMQLQAEYKMKQVNEALNLFRQYFQVVTLKDHAQIVRKQYQQDVACQLRPRKYLNR